MKLGDYIDEEKLAQYVSRGLVSARHHNTLPLTIYCYTRKAEYSHIWDDVTRKTRGLIVDKEGNIIARPYEKFFSIGQPGGLSLYEVQKIDEAYGPPVITEKINGHLGIFWRYGTHWGIATKGSFHSPHAEWATKWLEDHIEHNGKLVFPEGYTPVFEIICQDIQPHTIKYASDFVSLLSFVNIQTGEELEIGQQHVYAAKNRLTIATVYPMLKFEYARTHDLDFMEGYVATWNIPNEPPLKVKIKFPTFIENRRKFYAEQKLSKQLIYKKSMSTPLIVKEIVTEALVCCTTRKEFAEYFNRPENKEFAAECFKLLDYDNNGGK